MNGFYSLPEGHKVDNRDDIVVKIKEVIDKQYEGGRTTYMGDDELDAIIMSLSPELHKKLAIKTY